MYTLINMLKNRPCIDASMNMDITSENQENKGYANRII